MKPRPSFPVISFSAAAISKACARLSSAHGPAIKASGSVLPNFAVPTVTVVFGFALIIPFQARILEHAAARWSFYSDHQFSIRNFNMLYTILGDRRLTRPSPAGKHRFPRAFRSGELATILLPNCSV